MSEQERPNPKRLYRDPANGIIFGVCAGVADYFSWDVAVVRICTIIGALLTPVVWVAYAVMCFVLPRKPGSYRRKKHRHRREAEAPAFEDGQFERSAREEREQDRFWRSVRVSPADTFREIRHRFREMDARMQRMERYVTSRHYDLDREFRDLET